MKVSELTKKKMFPLNKGELEELAIKAGNINAFKALHQKEGYKNASKILGFEDEFLKYKLETVEQMATDPKAAMDLMDAYHHFLMAKICFPEDFDEISKQEQNTKHEALTPVQSNSVTDIPPSLKNKILRLTSDQLEEFAIDNGNRDAYRTLIEYGNYAQTCQFLGLEKKYEAYLESAQEAFDISPEEMSQTVENFEFFLLAKICFPEDFHQIEQAGEQDAKPKEQIPSPQPNISMHLPSSIKTKMFQLNFNQLRDLAVQNGNLAAYESLVKEEGYDIVVEHLDLQSAHEAYQDSVQQILRTTPAKLSQTVEDFEHFLMAKICFPNDF